MYTASLSQTYIQSLRLSGQQIFTYVYMCGGCSTPSKQYSVDSGVSQCRRTTRAVTDPWLKCKEPTIVVIITEVAPRKRHTSEDAGTAKLSPYWKNSDLLFVPVYQGFVLS